VTEAAASITPMIATQPHVSADGRGGGCV
jgi:hypothetical protein